MSNKHFWYWAPLMLALSSFADEVPAENAEEPAKQEGKRIEHQVKFTVLGGVTFYSFADETLKYQGTSLATSKGRSETTPSIGGELTYRPNPIPVSAGVIAEWDRFKSASGTPASEFGTYLVAKGHLDRGPVDLWGGVAGGPIWLSFGERSASTDKYLITLANPTMSGFCFTPRIGADYQLSETFSFGLQAAYYTYSGTVDIDVVEKSSGNTYKFQEDVSRNWWTAQARFGFKF